MTDPDQAPAHAHEILHELRQPALYHGASPTVLAQTLGTTTGALTRGFNWLMEHGHVTKHGGGRGPSSGVRYVAVERPPG